MALVFAGIAPWSSARATDAPGPAKHLPEELSPSAQGWVESALDSLSLEQKIAQLVMVRAFGVYNHPDSEEHRALLEEVRDLQVGGVVVFDSDLESIPRLLNDLQDAAPLPLLIGADLERGISFRARRGSVALPSAMALGATHSTEAARFAGEVTAREARALGIHWAFAPVVDVNNNPANPVVATRSFGEDPDWVGKLGAAFIEGAQSGGLLTTAKHFPGHGDTAVDSHFALPTIRVDLERLEELELAPFRDAIAAGVDSVMLAHLAVPALDPSGKPATLSAPIVTDLLRHELGFSGIIVTDAMEMKGVGNVWPGKATVQAIEAGADLALLPPDPKVAISALVEAVELGRISEKRIDTSVRRVLEAKARLGLHQERKVAAADLGVGIARPADVERVQQIAREAITLVRNPAGVVPLEAENPLRILHLGMSAQIENWLAYDPFVRALRDRRISVDHRHLGREVSDGTQTEILEAAGRSSHVLVSAITHGASTTRRGGLSRSHLDLLTELDGLDVPLVILSFGSPYVLSQLPTDPTLLTGYGPGAPIQRAMVEAVLGELEISGRLPVSIPGVADYGEGLRLAARPMSLAPASPAPDLSEVEALLASEIEAGAFPGASIAVGHGGQLLLHRGAGRLSYDPRSPAVSRDTLYDLASLTKVIATTTMAMILVDENRLRLDAPVVDFLPAFAGPNKERVTVRHLLTHSSGIDWWAPLYEELEGREAYLEHIQAMDLVYEPGTQALYSDLGIILLSEVLEKAAGVDFETFVKERIFEPLGMTNTGFRPAPTERHRIAPTEVDPWRGRLLRGEVHDENAFALGGVAPHAGLFSNAGDLARFAQMLLNGGVFEHRRIVSRQTVELFTRAAGVPDSTRALGWDTKSPSGSSAGELFSPSSYGHTGFTGTSLWIDPERELFMVLLTNRVHPSRENKRIRAVRPAVADAVVRAVEGR